MPQAFEHAYGRMDRSMGRAKPASAIPPPVGHLLLQQVVGKGVETVIVKLEVREDGKYHPRDARLARAPSVVDASIALEPFTEKEHAGLNYGWSPSETCITGMVLSILSYFEFDDDRLHTLAD